VIRALNAQLDNSAWPAGQTYLPLDNIKAWVLGFDMSTIPWGRGWSAFFANTTDATPYTQGLDSGGAGLPAQVAAPDPAVPSGSAYYYYQRTQVLFSLPTDYLLLCVGWKDGVQVYADEGCAGTFGGACGVMEIPWSVIPSYPFVQLYIQGPIVHDSAEYYPNLATAAANQAAMGTGPDWNPNQTCGGPISANTPYGGQFEAP
jgi:hypothetical protein